MQVLQINKFFFEKGGTERYFFSVSRALEKKGHTVRYFSMHHPSNLETPDSEYFVRQRDYADRTSLGSIPKGVGFIRSREAATNLTRLIAEAKPDIAHLHNIYHQITPSIIPVLQEAGVPMVMTLHDYKLICPNYSLFDGGSYCYRCEGGRFRMAPVTRCNGGSFLRSSLLAIEAYWQKRTKVYDAIRMFLAPSRYIRDKFVDAGFGDDRVAHLPSFLPSESESIESVRSSALVNLPERFVLYFGRLSVEKGVRTLIEAVAKTRDIPLVICGDGPLAHELKVFKRLKNLDHVLFTGHLSKMVLERVIQRARVVVQPSLSPENAPFSVLEAMEFGRPVIASAVGGLPELVEKAGGLDFAPGDSRALAARIKEVWEDDDLAARLGEAGRAMVADDFGEERHLARLEMIYHQVAS